MYCNPNKLLLRNNTLGNNVPKVIEPEKNTMSGGIIEGDNILAKKNHKLQNVAKQLINLKSQMKPQKKMKPPNITF